MTQKRFRKLLMGSKRSKSEKQTMSHHFARNCVQDVICVNRVNEWNFRELRRRRGNDFHTRWRGKSYQETFESLQKQGLFFGVKK